ncbi:lipopolysaccharide biosynthesis protein [Algibacter sp. Ld11]|uniref:lipopolysaccharide biosynthesis protein n=1 Tax=Algibacter sp. Ld11 TaxID=649150 RepID=UPI00386CA925
MDSKKIVSGVKWRGIQVVLDVLFRFSIRIILAKLLLPNEFGLVGMAMVFIAVATAASEFGIEAALVQKKDDYEAEKMYSTAFWTGLAWGLGLYLLISFIVGPFAANFYEEPMLITLVPVLSLSILFRPLILIHTVILTRAMNFKKMAKIFNLSALIAGVTALISAYFNFGVWALVINSVLGSLISFPLLLLATKWKPNLEWNKEHFKNIFGFGAYSTATTIFGAITYNIDNLMIGKLLGSSSLGAYTLSFSLTEQLRQVISNVLNKVMYPVFGKSQDNKEKLKDYFLKIINLNSLVAYPLMAFILIFSEDIILGFFGDKWIETIVPLQILSIAMMVHLSVNSFTSLIRGLGKPQLEMKIIIGLTLIVLVPSLYIGIVNYGLKGAAYAILLNKIALVIVATIVLRREIDLSFFEILKAIKSAFLGVLCASSAVFITCYFININNLLVLAPIYIIFYLLIIYKLEKIYIIKVLKLLK